MRRLLRVLLVALIAPLLVVGQGGSASAVVVAGSELSADIDSSKVRVGGVPLDYGDTAYCSVTARWETTDGVGPGAGVPLSYVAWAAKCNTGFNVSSWVASFQFNGVDLGAGEPCSVETAAFEYDGHPTHSGQSDALAGSVAGGVPAASDCGVTELCMWAKAGWHLGIDNGEPRHKKCVEFHLGHPPDPAPGEEPPQACGDAIIAKPVFKGDPYIGDYPGPAGTRRLQWVQDVEVSITGGASPPAGGFALYAVYSPATSTDNRINTNPSTVGSQYTTSSAELVGPVPFIVLIRELIDAPVGVVTDALLTVPLGASIQKSGSAEPSVMWEVVGFGVYAIPESSTVDRPKYRPPWHSGAPNGRVGKTSAADCAFYWGEKLVENSEPSESRDDPLGGVSAPEPPEDPDPIEEPSEEPEPYGSCEFSFLDPGSWATGGICELVRGIRQLIGTVAGMVNALLSGLSALFVTLFVPSPGHISSAISDVREAWSGTAPVEIAESVAEIPTLVAVPSSSGCEGPTLGFDLGTLGGEFEVNPLSYCRPEIGQIRSIAYVGMQAGIWLGAVLMAVRLLGSALGYNVNSFGRGGDDE